MAGKHAGNKKRVLSHSASPNPAKESKKGIKRHKKHYSTFVTVSPLKMMRTWKNKRFSNKSIEKSCSSTNKNFKKKPKKGKGLRDWSPISQKLSSMRKKMLRKE